jgi:hypothetical protein
MVSWWQVYHSSICGFSSFHSSAILKNHNATPIHEATPEHPLSKAAELRKYAMQAREPFLSQT